ncbi:anti-sigma factor RsbA family regulatory protein [Nocardia tengchongensis]|uniref:anti-sigma factor RsbA family regulatory protein n=1 Tax=Nocardia tengchongensis TaxID=2055889 RepID=UPI0036642E3D
MTDLDAVDGATNPFVHPALFYGDIDEYLSGTIGFIRDGLVAGEPVAVAVPTANLALLRAELGSDADSVRFMDMTIEGRNPGRIIPGVLRPFADAHPVGRVRIIGEPIWASRSELEYPACVQHEALINAAFNGCDVTILCPYNTVELGPVAVADARATHPAFIDSDGESVSLAYNPDLMVAAYNLPPADPPAGAALFAFDAVALRSIRYCAADFARSVGMTSGRIVDLALIVGETTTNSVVHGGGRGTLALWRDDAQLCCQVRDAGHIENPLAGRLPAPVCLPGGRGLLLVNQLADLVRIHTDASGTTLHMRVSLA